MPPSPDPAHLAPLLLRWFRRAKRDLPWRRTGDPYHIWVAEVMLQQTQVDRVISFYERFIHAFPTMDALAAAPLDAVLRLWAGLGYYSRARSLHAACRSLVERGAGRFPTSYDQALALPGVGAYTAGAILSIAFGQRHPALDANARRVLSRVFHRRGDSPAEARKRMNAFGAAAVPADRPGDYNQALMELGSLVCLPRRPRCDACCLADICRARALDATNASPTTRRPRVQTARAACAIVRRRGRYLIAQRPLTGVWAGLWEFPNCEPGAGEDPRAALRTLLLSDFGLEVTVGPELATLTHGIMSRRIHLTAYACTVTRGSTKARRHLRTRWVTPSQLAQYALPAPHSRAGRMFLSAAIPGSPSDPPPAS
jgi:A/G-specific adenine glycosylase